MGGPATYDLDGVTRPPERGREFHHVAEPTEPGVRAPGPSPEPEGRGDAGPGRAAASFTLEETARRAGHYKWTEMRLFEVLGGWIATVPELDAKMVLSAHCHHHAWHAELWHHRLPALREMDGERLTVAANDEMVAFMAALAGPDAPDQTIEKLVGVYRVLIPHLVAAYTHHLDHTSAATDGPTIRVLRLALRDEMEDWRDGELLVQSLVDSPAAVDRAATHVAKLQKVMLAAGGVAGPGSSGARSGDARREPG